MISSLSAAMSVETSYILLCTFAIICLTSCDAVDHTENETLQLRRLEREVSGLLERVETLETQDKLKKDLILEQKAEIDNLRSEVKEAREVNAATDKLLTELSRQISHMQQDDTGFALRRRQIETDNYVAFYGKLNVLVSDVGQNEIIKFNNIVTDIGHAYDSSTGLFTAPVPGVYVFSTTVMVEKRLDMHMGIYINNNMATNIKLHGVEHEYDTMSQTVVYYLNEQDTVSVRHYEGNKTIHGDYTTLTGFLLYQDFSQITGTQPINVIG